MVFIGGAGNGSKDLGRRTNQVCPGCGSRLGMQLIRTNGYIHLFFVPVFRYDIQYFLICPNCGKTYEISREDGRRLERQPGFALPPDHLIPTGNRPAPRPGSVRPAEAKPALATASAAAAVTRSDLSSVNHQSSPPGDGFFCCLREYSIRRVFLWNPPDPDTGPGRLRAEGDRTRQTLPLRRV